MPQDLIDPGTEPPEHPPCERGDRELWKSKPVLAEEHVLGTMSIQIAGREKTREADHQASQLHDVQHRDITRVSSRLLKVNGAGQELQREP